MHDPARISVIIPAYNVESYVEAAVQSVLQQTMPAYEIILINDGSTDGTREILTGYAQHPNVKYVEQTNTGPGAARNRGAALASGDYIYFFDADDVLDEGFIHSMQLFVSVNPQLDLIMFSGESFTDEAALNGQLEEYRRRVEASGVTGLEALALLGKTGGVASPAWLYLTRRSYWQRSEIAFPDTVYEDEDVLIALVIGASSVMITDTVFFYRRLRPGSIVTTRIGEQHLAGRESNVRTAIENMRLVPARHKEVRLLLRRRCRGLAKQYVDVAANLQRATNKSLLFKAIWITRSMSLLRKIAHRILLKNLQTKTERERESI